jgi:GH24 family phage-related lysozyme (muramidase)
MTRDKEIMDAHIKFLENKKTVEINGIKKEVLDHIEGISPHFYRDSAKEGHLTIGIGHKLKRGESTMLPMYHKKNPSKRASVEEIQKEVVNVMKLRPNQFLKYYEENTTLLIDDETIKKLHHEDSQTALKNAKNQFSEFYTYPLEAQVILLDMMFNPGPGRVKEQFVRFRRAVLARNWEWAAEESSRVDGNRPLETRNAATVEWLMKAQATEDDIYGGRWASRFVGHSKGCLHDMEHYSIFPYVPNPEVLGPVLYPARLPVKTGSESTKYMFGNKINLDYHYPERYKIAHPFRPRTVEIAEDPFLPFWESGNNIP